MQELQAKNEAANAKLRQMVKDQQEAEKKKVQSQEIQQKLAVQTIAIDQKRDDVMVDLAQVEPAVIDAQTGTYLSYDITLTSLIQNVIYFYFFYLNHVFEAGEKCKHILSNLSSLGKVHVLALTLCMIFHNCSFEKKKKTITAVKGIKRQHLVELRSMANPPGLVKLALESICLFLGESASDWKQIRAVLMKDSFIPSIVNFTTEEIT